MKLKQFGRNYVINELGSGLRNVNYDVTWGFQRGMGSLPAVRIQAARNSAAVWRTPQLETHDSRIRGTRMVIRGRMLDYLRSLVLFKVNSSVTEKCVTRIPSADIRFGHEREVSFPRRIATGH